MAMFDDIEKLAIHQANQSLGNEITYTDSNGFENKFKAIVHATTLEVDAQTGQPILSDKISIDIDLNDVTPEEGDTVQYKGISYKVAEVMKDSFHSAKILLQRAEYY